MNTNTDVIQRLCLSNMFTEFKEAFCRCTPYLTSRGNIVRLTCFYFRFPTHLSGAQSTSGALSRVASKEKMLIWTCVPDGLAGFACCSIQAAENVNFVSVAIRSGLTLEELLQVPLVHSKVGPSGGKLCYDAVVGSLPTSTLSMTFERVLSSSEGKRISSFSPPCVEWTCRARTPNRS
jgi:hypothetical protein